MQTNKYPKLRKYNEQFFNYELTYVGTGATRIPVVLGRSFHQMTLFWWNPHKEFWDSHTWETPDPDRIIGPTLAPSDVSRSYAWNYSQRQGLAGDEKQVFVAYKGRMNIYTKHFIWDETQGQLIVTNTDPANIPVNLYEHDGGLVVKAWISKATNRFLVLSQTFPKNPDGVPSLTLFLYNLEGEITPTTLINYYHWDAIDLAEGGYDFDARFTDPLIHVVHKTQPYSLWLEKNTLEDGVTDIDLDDIPEDQYIPLE